MTRVDYRQVMQELIALWDEQLELGSIGLDADEHHKSVPVIVRGLTAHVVDNGRATLTLYEAELAASAMPIIRGMLEDVITAEWVLTTPEGWRAIQVKSARQTHGSIKDYLKREPEDSFIQQRLLELGEVAYPQGGTPGLQVSDRARTVPGFLPDYEMYRLASDLTHAGMGVVHLYYAGRPSDGQDGVAFNSSALHPGAPGWFANSTWFLHRALTAWDSLVTNQPLRQRLLVIRSQITKQSEREAANEDGRPQRT
jgi:hypothetical protein